MASSLYVNIRGDYSQFQKDVSRLRGIARTSAKELSDIFGNAFSKGDAQRGLTQIGMALKKLGAVANTVGAQFKPAIAEINEFARKCGASSAEVKRLVEQMGYAARERQMESSLRALQRQAGLTDSALSQLARRRHLFAEAGNIASEGLGVRTASKIKADIQEAENAFQQFEIAARKTGESTQRQFEAMTEKVRQFKRELMTSAERKRDDYNQLWAKTTTAAPTDKGYQQYTVRQSLKEGMSGFQELHGRLPRTVSEMRQLAQATGATIAQVRRLRDELQKSSGFFNTILESVKQRVFFGLGTGLVDSIRTAMRVENVEVAFKAIYGTSDMAAKKLNYVKQVSDELGLSFMDTAEGAKKLFAAAQGTPVEKDANMVFKAFSNMSAALKLTGDETKGVFLALSQMISKGKVSAEELRQQLAERMPGAVNLFAKSIGVTTQELDKMLQKGGVTLEHFVKFAAEVNKTYAAGAQMAGNSLQAQLNRLGNTWVDFQSKMVDTGSFASLVRDFNSALKPTLQLIVSLSKYAGELVAGGFAAWLVASATAGGKLNAVFASLKASLQASIEAYQKTAIAQTAVGATATTAATRVRGLGAALWTIVKNPIVLAGMMAIGAAFTVWEVKAHKAQKAFKDVNKTMSEYVHDMQMSKEADMASRFTPETLRNNVLADAKTAVSDWQRDWKMGEGTIQQAMQDVIYKTPLKYKPGSYDLDTSARDLGIESLKEAKKAADDYSAALQKAVENKDLNGVNDVLNQMAENWGKIKTKMLGSKSVPKEAIEFMEKAYAGLYETGSRAYADLTRWQQTFSADSISAAKALGLNLDALKKSYDGLAKAASGTKLGKALADIQSFEKVTQYLGQTGAAFDSVVASTGKYMDEVVNLTNSLASAQKKHDEFGKELQNIGDDYSIGIVKSEEYRKALQDNDAQTKALQEQQEKLTQSIFNAAAAAGGSPAAFNTLIAVFKQAAEAAGMVEAQVNGIVQRLADLQFQAWQTVNQASAMAIDNQTKMMTIQHEEAVAWSQGNEKGVVAARAHKIETQNNGREISGVELDALRHQVHEEARIRKEREAMRDALKKGKRGGGGGKRVDNTAEKYNSAFEGFRKEIAKLQGEVDRVTLDKKFADMDKQLKGSTADIKALKKEYFEAFNANKVQELRKEIMQLTGDEQALADLEMAEKMKAFNAEMEGVAKAAKDLGREVPDDLNKFKDAYAKALETNNREQELQRFVSLAGDLLLPEEQRKQVYEAQNELIEIQYEKMKKISPEIAEIDRRMKELEARVKNNDPFAGMQLGFERWRKSAGNMAENLADTVENAFKGMEDAFVKFVQTGKLSFTDLANSIIADLVRMSVRASMSGIWDLIGQGLGVLAGAFSSSAVTGKGMSFAGKGGSESASLGLMRHGHALGDVFTGLCGYSNQIVSRPTLFSYGSQLTKFAKGGVMGEAGPEAVMPLMRTASGHLGVRSEGSGQAPVIVNIINNTGQEAKQESKIDGDGTRSLEVTIGDMAASQMLKNGSTLNKAVRAYTGQNQQVVRR